MAALADPREAIRPWPPPSPFQSYAVANTATFLFEATRERDKNIKNTKYLGGNSALDCQNPVPWTALGLRPQVPVIGSRNRVCHALPPFPVSGMIRQ